MRSYNSRTYTETNLESILYDLKKCNSISEGDILRHSITENNISSGSSTLIVNVQKSASKNLEDKATLDVFSNVIRKMSEEQKQGFTMATQYPFLLEADCPIELQALSTQAVNSFHAYRDAHEKLFQDVANTQEPKMTNAEIYELASQLLGDYHLNKEIHAELSHYAKEKTFLGEHPIFTEWKKEKDQSDLTPADLAKKIKNIGPRISKLRGKLQGATREQRTEINQSIKDLENERAALQKKLDAKQ